VYNKFRGGHTIDAAGTCVSQLAHTLAFMGLIQRCGMGRMPSPETGKHEINASSVKDLVAKPDLMPPKNLLKIPRCQ
jgi:hypothetical protein